MSASPRSPAARALSVLAVWIACAAFFVTSLSATPGGVPPSPDSQHYADVARNLLRGNGFVVDIIEYHLGLRDAVRHVPEHHGISRPIALLPVFALFGATSPLLRVPGLAYHALSGVVGFFLARRLFGATAGCVAALLILTDGLLGFCALNGSDDMGFAFFCLCTIAALERGLSGGREAWFAVAGMAAGLAILEKQIGVFLPVVLLVPLLGACRAPRAVALRRAGLALVPFALCFSLYLMRNELAYSSLAFRMYPIQLIEHVAGWEGVYRIHPATLGSAETLDSIGRAKVLWFSVRQLAVFAHEVVGLPLPGARGDFPSSNLMVALGFASLVLLVRVRPWYVLLCMLCTAGGLLLVCGMWHVQFRYFAFLVPLLAVALAGVVTRGVRGVGDGWQRWLLRVAALAAGLAVLAPSAVSLARTALAAASAPAAAKPVTICADALAWIRIHTGAGDRVVSLDPWGVAWEADRPGVMAPAGGVRAIETVVRHYDASFLVISSMPGRAATRRSMLEFAANPPSGLRSALVFDGLHCDVIELRREP